jgi:hypothetical protein
MRTAFAIFLIVFSARLAAEEAYKNPVDGKTYVTDGEWKTYEPQGGSRPFTDKVSLQDVRLLQDQATIEDRTSVEDLSDFIRSAVSVGKDIFDVQQSELKVLVQFTCTPGTHKIELAYDGKVEPGLLPAFYDALSKLSSLAVTGEVRFQFTLEIVP